MKDDSGGLVAILIVLLGGLFVALPGGGGNPAKEPATSSRESTAQPIRGGCDEDLTAVVTSFLDSAAASRNGSSTSPRSDNALSTGNAMERLKRLAWDAMYPVEILIATVPDPVDSAVGWRFDERVAAIKQAVEDTGHVFDRFWLPWKCEAGESGAAAHRTTPGVLVFRGLYHTLVVLLVGEAPTWGVQKAALRTSLKFVQEWRELTVDCDGWKGRRDPHKGIKKAGFKCPQLNRSVYLLGPTYSGSITSIRRVLVEWRQQEASPPRVRIVSGSATNAMLREILTQGTDKAFVKNVRLQTAVLPDSVLVSALETYLREEGGNPAKVAILVESGTAYGQMFKAELKGRRGNGGGEWRILPFPLHIAHIREASKAAKKKNSSDPAEEILPEQGLLEVELGEIGEARDVLPSMVPGVSGASDELALANILSIIARDGFTHVGLFATDVRDKLLLAERIKTYAPGVTLFTFESDLLYGHPDHNRNLEGMLVASTYPLFAPNQIWSTSGDVAAERRGMLQFPSDGAQGTYNATLVQLNRMHRELTHLTLDAPPEKTQDADPSKRLRSVTPLLEYSTPFEPQSRYPPVWISVVGRRGAWPLRAFSLAELACRRDNNELATSSDCLAAKDQDNPRSFEAFKPKALVGGPFGTGYPVFPAHDKADSARNLGSAWVAFVGVLALATLLLGVYLWTCPPRRFVAEPEPTRGWALLRPRRCAVCRSRQGRYLWGLFAMVSTALILMFRPYPHFLGVPALVFFGVLLSLTVLVPVYVAVMLFLDRGEQLSAGTCMHRHQWAGWRKAGCVGVALLQVGLLCAVAWVVVDLGGVPAMIQELVGSSVVDLRGISPAMQEFLLHRVGYLGSGLSLLAPVVFLTSGLTWWYFLNLRRLELIESSMPRIPACYGGAGPLFRILRAVRQAIQTPWRSARVPYVVTGVILLGMLPVGFVLSWVQPTFEGIALGSYLLRIVLVIYNSVLTIALFHLVFLWWRLRRVPQYFEARWQRRAYGRLAEALPRDVLKGFWARPIKVTDLEAFVRLARRAANAASHAEAQGADAGKHRASNSAVRALVRSARAAANSYGPDVKLAAQTNQWTHFATSATQIELSKCCLEASQLLDQLETAESTRKSKARGADGTAWIAALEDLVASQYVVFLAPAFLCIRGLATFIVGASLLFLLAVTSYPVQPAGLLKLHGFTWLFMGGGAALLVSWQARSDRVLRQLEVGSEQHQGWFDQRMATTLGTYVLLPALGLFAAQSPEFAGVLEQFLRIFR
jgi:hypothetical protein